jgi:hypothetical protein
LGLAFRLPEFSKRAAIFPSDRKPPFSAACAKRRSLFPCALFSADRTSQYFYAILAFYFILPPQSAAGSGSKYCRLAQREMNWLAGMSRMRRVKHLAECVTHFFRLRVDLASTPFVVFAGTAVGGLPVFGLYRYAHRAWRRER